MMRVNIPLLGTWDPVGVGSVDQVVWVHGSIGVVLIKNHRSIWGGGALQDTWSRV